MDEIASERGLSINNKTSNPSMSFVLAGYRTSLRRAIRTYPQSSPGDNGQFFERRIYSLARTG
jgi:hypothetical protein